MTQLTTNGLTGTIHDLHLPIRGLMFSASLIGATKAANYFSEAADWTNYDEDPEPADILHWLIAGREALHGQEYAELLIAAADSLVVTARRYV